MIMVILSKSKILKFNLIEDKLNSFCNSFNSIYKDLDSKGNVLQLLMKILPNISKAKKYFF